MAVDGEVRRRLRSEPVAGCCRPRLSWPASGRFDDRRVGRDSLLEQKLRSAHHRLGVEPPRHQVVEQGVGQGHQAHALMMGHVRSHDRQSRILGEPFRRVIDGLVEAEWPLGPVAGQTPEVRQGFAGSDHRRHDRRVRGDNPILLQPPLEAQPGHAERLILIIALEELGIVCGFGDPPGDSELLAILDLAGHGGPARLGEQRIGQGAQEQSRHQVLEHRPAPGDQADPPRRPDVGAPELEPVAPGGVSARDRQVAGQAGFRGEQVVAGPVELPLAQVRADREEVPFRLVERAEVHGGGKGVGAVDELEQAIAQAGCRGVTGNRLVLASAAAIPTASVPAIASPPRRDSSSRLKRFAGSAPRPAGRLS